MRQARGGVLVVGGGFAGGYVARLLGRSGATIVSPENFMLYTPMLPEAASGTLEPRHTVVPLRQMCPRAELVLGRVTALDEERQSVQVETPDVGTFELGYEQLVLALGAVTRTFPVPGLAEYGLGFKNLADAILLRNRILRELEAADAAVDEEQALPHLGFVFVGAGLRGRRGARGALGPRPRRAPLVPPPPRRTAALGARRRGAEDPVGDPDAARRLRRKGAERSRRRDPRLDDAHIVRRRRRRTLQRRTNPTHGRSSGPRG